MQFIQLGYGADHVAGLCSSFSAWAHGSLNSRLAEEVLARIFRCNCFELLHQITDALVGRRRHDHLDFDVLIAAFAVARARHAFFLESQGLAAVRARRNSNERSSVDCGDFYFCAERRLRHCDGNFRVEIVAAPFEKLVGFDHDGQVQIAGGSSHRSGISFPRNAHAATVGYAWGNAHIDGLVVADTAFAAARFARGAQLAGAAAAIAWDVETHFARGLLNRAAAIASRTDLRRTDRARSVAGLAGIEPRNLNFLYGAANRIPKIDFEAVFEVRALFGFLLHARATAAAEERTEQVAQ